MKINKLVKAPLGIAGASIGMGIVGNAINSTPIQEAGQITSKFVGPAVNIAAGGYVVNMLRDLKPKKRENKNADFKRI